MSWNINNSEMLFGGGAFTPTVPTKFGFNMWQTFDAWGQ